MGSTRAGGRAAGGQARRGADLVAAAAELRWARPDLTAALADHVLEEASAAGEQERWLAAAGWAVHARSVTGDGRKIACDVLAGLPQWGGSVLAQPAARRLRVELAMVAAGAGEVDVARKLIAPVAADGDSEDAELQADLLGVRARCAVEDAPEEVNDAISAAAAAWAGVGGPGGEFGGASVALVSAVVERRAGRPVAAVDHAADGLSRLERGRGRTAAASGHLAAALAAEWIAALLDAGRGAEARDGCNALLPGLSERARPSRQMALLRLTVARAVAAQDAAADTAQLLEQAAEDAAGSDVPDLEAVCRTALGALYEKASRLDTALESLQLAVSAERRDRARSRRFVAALAELAPEAVSAATSSREHRPTEPVPVETVPVEAASAETALTASAPVHAGPAPARPSADGPASDATTVLPAITRGDRKLARRRWEELLDAGSEDEPRAAADGEGGRPAAAPARSRFELMLEGEPATGPAERGFGQPDAAAGIGWEGVSWSDSAGDSPIGDLLSRSMRSGAADEGGSEHRNGRTSDEPVNGDGAGEPRRRRAGRRQSAEHSETEHSADSKTAHPKAGPGSEPGGWMPAVDAARFDERRRRRGRTRSRSGSDDAAAASREQGSATDAGITASSTRSGPAEASNSDLLDPAVGRSILGRAEGEPRSERRSRAVGRDGADAAAERTGARGRHDRTSETGDDPAPGRRRRESGSTDPLGVALEIPTGAHAGPDTAESGRESHGEEAWGTAPENGHRHRADDPWATGSWTVRPAGRSDTSAPAETPAEAVRQEDVAESQAVEQPTVAGGSDSWLEAALADLDRALGSGLAKSAAPEPDLEQDGCAVVIDIARDGRRFAGRRAAAVVRSVADRVTDRLPQGARLRFGDSDILSITGPGWSRSEATEWMHRTLPGLLDGFESEEDLPAAQLRAAVHDANGPVGAQILQNLARSPGRRRADPAPGAAEHGLDPRSELGKRSSEARGREYRAAGRSGRRERAGSTRSGTRSRRDAGEIPERPARDDTGGWPWAGADTDLTFPDGSGALSGLDVEVEPAHGFDLDRPAPGRHEANGRAAGGSGSGTDGPPTSRHRAGGAQDEPAGEAGAGRRARRSADRDSGVDSTGTDRDRTARGNGHGIGHGIGHGNGDASTSSGHGDHRARGGNGIGSNGTAGGAGSLDDPWTGGIAANGSGTGGTAANGSAAGGYAAGDNAAGGYAADGSAAGDRASGDRASGDRATDDRATGGDAGGRANGGGRTGASGTGGSAVGGTRSSGRRSGWSEPDGETDGAAANGGGPNGGGSNGGGSNGSGTDRSGADRSGTGRSGTGSVGADGLGAGKPDAPEPTDGLGIADLLAGALAAYRGI